MTALDSVPETPRRDTREWVRIAPGLRNQAGTVIYKSTVYEGGRESPLNFRARNVTEAKQRHEARRVNVLLGAEPERSKLTLDELMDDFEAMFSGLVATGERKKSTLDGYRLLYRVHVQPRLGGMKV